MQVRDRSGFGLEQHGQVSRQTCADQILDDLLLAVDDDRAPGELRQRDAVALALEADLDALVHQTLALQAVAHAGAHEQIDRAVLEHAGSDTLLDVLARSTLEDDGFDPLLGQQVRQHQARGAGADDANLRTHRRPPCSGSVAGSVQCWVMPGVVRVVGVVLVGIAVVLVVAAVAVYVVSENKLNQTLSVPTENVPIPTDTSAIQRGQHLAAAVGVCVDCHGMNLAGKVFIDDPALGRIVAANLTRGRGGVGATYSDADMARSIRHGVSPTGRHAVDHAVRRLLLLQRRRPGRDHRLHPLVASGR